MAGIKELTAENWTTPDPAMGAFGEINLAMGEQRPSDGNQLAEQLLRYTLDDGVPADVRAMWDIARGALLYSWFFYPLYALGQDQLHRVADAAVLFRYQQLDGPRDGRTGRWPDLKPRLDWMVRHGHINPELKGRWEAIRDLRNYGSHATYVRLSMPSDAMTTLAILSQEINGLFRYGSEASAV
jgi:hypothetical protein